MGLAWSLLNLAGGPQRRARPNPAEEDIGMKKTLATIAIAGPFAASSIRVETLKGQVQLSGCAKSADERQRAEVLARSVKGVAGVRSCRLTPPAGA